MSKTAVFIAGLVVGSGVVAVAENHGWFQSVNEVVSRRADMRFTEEWPPGPCTPGACIHVNVGPATDTVQIVTGSHAPNPPLGSANPPPEPEFSATFNPPPVPDQPAPPAVLQVFHPENLIILAPDGSAAQLCASGPSQLPG